MARPKNVRTLLQLELEGKESALKILRQEVMVLREKVVAEKEALAKAKVEEKAAKEKAALEKAQARLQRLLEKSTPKVGAAARKASKRPSKPVVVTEEELVVEEV